MITIDIFNIVQNNIVFIIVLKHITSNSIIYFKIIFKIYLK